MGLIAGIGAKELVASTIGVLYSGDDDSLSLEGRNSSLYKKMSADGISTASAVAFLVFVLLYFPCIATVIAIKNESGSWKWTAFVIAYTSVVAWVLSAIAYLILQ